MSMREYAVTEYGLVLNQAELRIVASQAYDAFDDDIWEYCDDFENRFGVLWISEFTGEAMLVDNNGDDDWRDSRPFCGDPVFYIPISRYPSLFTCGYKDINELVTEFRNNEIVKYLPEDFDIRSNIRHIVGTYYG